MNRAVRGTSLLARRGLQYAPLLASVVITMAGCRAGDAASAKESVEQQTEAVAVRTKAAEVRTITQRLQALGTCEPHLDKIASLTPAVDGQVVQILARPGDTVQARQPLVQLDSRLADANLSEKKATRDGLLASLASLKALPRPEEQRGYQLAIDEAKLGVQKAEAVVGRLQPLLERHEIPPQQMLDAKTTLDQARVQFEKAQSQFRVAMMGPRPEAIQEAQAHIAAAEMVLATAEAQRDLLCLRAPIDGVLDKLTCRLGQMLAVGTPVGEVVDTRRLYALIWLPPRDVQLVRVGQKAHIQAAEPSQRADERSAALSGQIEFVGRSADPQTGNLPVRVVFDNPEQRLGTGQRVAMEIVVCEKTTLAVPADAVFDLEEGPAVSVVRGGKSVVLHPHLGLRDKDWIGVEQTDLKAGEHVIVEGGWGLPEQTSVREEECREAASPEKPSEGKKTVPSQKTAEGKS